MPRPENSLNEASESEQHQPQTISKERLERFRKAFKSKLLKNIRHKKRR